MTAAPSSRAEGQSACSEFVDLLCADEELLRAEFDAIMAASWPDEQPPARPPQSGGVGQRAGGRSQEAVAASRLHGPRCAVVPRIDSRSRQRSPPEREA